MSIRIGIYDFFGYAIPGICYLALTLYGISVFGYLNIDLTILVNLSLFSALIIVGAGYILGVLLDPIAYRWKRLFYMRNSKTAELAYISFQERHPWLIVNFAPTDWAILLRIIKDRSIEVAIDVELHNVASIMMRNISLGLIMLSMVYFLFYFAISAYLWNLVIASICIFLSIIALRRSQTRRKWFYLAIFEAFVAQNVSYTKWVHDRRCTQDVHESHEGYEIIAVPRRW